MAEGAIDGGGRRSGMDAGGVRAREAVASVAEASHRQLVALLAMRTRDASGAQDAVADAFAAALVEWPARGVPERPEAWIAAVARRKWIDAVRRRQSAERAREHLRLLADEAAHAEAERSTPDEEPAPFSFLCGHPALEPGIRAPILLQTVLGFEAAEIARAFRVSSSAMSQRLVRAKQRLRAAGSAFEPPSRAEMRARRERLLGEVRAALLRGREAGAA